MVELPQGQILAEVKYRENASVKENDAIIEMSKKDAQIIASLVITKRMEDYGVIDYSTRIPVMRIPAHAFLYLLGHAEKHHDVTSGSS